MFWWELFGQNVFSDQIRDSVFTNVDSGEEVLVLNHVQDFLVGSLQWMMVVVMSHHHHHMTSTPTSWTMWSASATPPTHFCPTTRLWRWTTIDALASSSNFCPKTVNQHNHENVCKHHHHQSASPSLSSKSFSKGFLQPRPSRHLGCVGHYHHHHYHYHHPPFPNLSTFFEIFLIKSIIMKWSSPMIRCVGPHLQQNPTQTQSQRSCLGQNNHLQMHKFKEAVVT